MSLEILNPSFFASLQDRGRFGFNHIGVTSTGVSDEFAYKIANMLLNQSDTSVLEISFSNFEAKFLKATQITLCGAVSEVFLNDKQINTWQTYNIKAGQILKIGKFQSGAKLYLAIKGGFKIKKEFGSCSTSIKEKLGGLNADFLKKGDVLQYDEFVSYDTFRLKKQFIPNYSDELELRVITTYQDDSFEPQEKENFFSSIYTITNDFNKMACKLNGESIKSSLDGIISEGIVFGSIQIPSDGQPIILLKDRQTIGGYPKIGVILDVDCFKLSQMKPNNKIRFKQISYEEACEISRKFYTSFLK